MHAPVVLYIYSIQTERNESKIQITTIQQVMQQLLIIIIINIDNNTIRVGYNPKEIKRNLSSSYTHGLRPCEQSSCIKLGRQNQTTSSRRLQWLET